MEDTGRPTFSWVGKLSSLLSGHEEFMDVIYSSIWIPRFIAVGMLDTLETQRLRHINVFPPFEKIRMSNKYPSLVITLLEYSIGIMHLTIEYLNNILVRNIYYRHRYGDAGKEENMVILTTAMSQLSAAIVFRTLTLLPEFKDDDVSTKNLSRLVYCMLNADLVAFNGMDNYSCDWEQILLKKHDDLAKGILYQRNNVDENKIKELFPGFSRNRNIIDAIRNLLEDISRVKIHVKEISGHNGNIEEGSIITGNEFIYMATKAVLTPDALSPIFIEMMLRTISTAGLRRIDPAKLVYTLTEYIDVYLDKDNRYLENKEDKRLVFYLRVPSLAMADRFLDTYMSYLASYYAGFYDEPSALEYTAELPWVGVDKKINYILSHIETSMIPPDELRIHIAEHLNYLNTMKTTDKQSSTRTYSIFEPIDQCILDSFLAYAFKYWQQTGISLEDYIRPIKYYIERQLPNKITDNIEITYSFAYRTPALIAYPTLNLGEQGDIREKTNILLRYLEKICGKNVVDYGIGRLTWADIIKDIISQSLPLLVTKIVFQDKSDEATPIITKLLLRDKVSEYLEEIE